MSFQPVIAKGWSNTKVVFLLFLLAGQTVTILAHLIIALKGKIAPKDKINDREMPYYYARQESGLANTRTHENEKPPNCYWELPSKYAIFSVRLSVRPHDKRKRKLISD